MKYKKRTIGILTIAIIFVSYSLISLFTQRYSQPTELGFTFSKKYAEYLGLDWKEAYKASIDELGLDYVRIPVYWTDVEHDKDSYWFDDVKFQVEYAQEKEIKSVVVLGMRQPRWPECFVPDWAQNLSVAEREIQINELVTQSVNALKELPGIEAWQVENEPMLGMFGVCPPYDFEQLKREVELVKSLDTRPVIVTASGELSTWYRETKIADIFGSTMYRITGNSITGTWKAYWFIPASWYRIKAMALGIEMSNYWIMELQAEPWLEEDIHTLSLEEQLNIFNSKQLEDHIEYARLVGSPRVYLWGVEWWYYLKTTFDNDLLWHAVKEEVGKNSYHYHKFY
ncbi:cellulase family glycosylhydrolase, partial [Candidatus Falkowbacteria bacterium]|nr:cellulase family glycosylhydrolase [Candidatus Falkowbacteria bacterium]